MRPISLVLPLLFALAGCPHSGGTPGSGAAGGTQASAGSATPAAAAEADAVAPAAAGPSAREAADMRDAPGATGAPAGRSAAQQGIRVGEPDPTSPRGPLPPAGSGWHAFGNEPFWSVQARGGTLVFATPENQSGTTLLGRRVPSLVGTAIIGSGPRGDFHFGVTPGKCSDGMSDRSFAYASTFIYGGTTYKGCAEPVGTPPRR